jgi:hypothetical protein
MIDGEGGRVMWRYWAIGAAVLAAVAGGAMLFGGSGRPALLPAQPSAQAAAAPATGAAAADPVPEASEATREQKRFARYDRDQDGKVTRDEYLANRRKGFAKLDVNGDGRLDFDEWAAKATAKFVAADHDKSGAMDAVEFATTAVKRKPSSRPKCPPTAAAPAEES